MSPSPQPVINPTTPSSVKPCCVCNYFKSDKDDFKSCCDSWFNTNGNNCSQKAYNVVTYDSKKNPPMNLGDPTGGLKNCTSLTSHYCGHGIGCQNAFKIIAVCLETFPGCSLNLDLKGCKIFKSIEEANTYEMKVQANLGGSQCVKISANQCNDASGYGSCTESKYIINITSNGVCGQGSACNFGEYCSSLDSKARCTKTSPDGSKVNSCKKCNYSLWNLLQWDYQWEEAPLSECP